MQLQLRFGLNVYQLAQLRMLEFYHDFDQKYFSKTNMSYYLWIQMVLWRISKQNN